MTYAPIATPSDVRQFAGITSLENDPLIASLITQGLQAIGNFCNRNFVQSAVTEYRDGNGASAISTANYPITSFSSLVIDGVTIPKSDGISSGYFFIPNSRRVILRGYRFTPGYRNVVMNFTAGYGDTIPWPDDLKLALMMYVTTRFKERSRLGVGSKSLAGESVTYTDATSGTSGSSQGIPSAARIILENYLNTVPENGL